MIFTITNAGLFAAASAGQGGPKINITTFQLGTSYGYTPSLAATGLSGSVVHTGVPSNYSVLGETQVEYALVLNEAIGDFSFGECCLKLEDGTVFAIGTLGSLQAKTKSTGSSAGNFIQIDARLSFSQASAVIDFPILESTTAKLLEVNSLELLDSPAIADSNAYLTHSVDDQGNSITAFKNQLGFWDFLTHTSKIVSGTVQGNGSGYTYSPAVVFTGGGGTGASATCSILNGAVSSVALTNAGSGYTSAPTISFTGNGTGAQATCTITQGVTTFTMVTGGSGYTTPPTVTITSGGGQGATATATISGGVVTGVSIVNKGTGYTSNPTVTFTGGGGTGASATAAISGIINTIDAFAPDSLHILSSAISNTKVTGVTPGKYIVQFTSGALSGLPRLVVGSNNNRITVNTAWGGVPAIGDTFNIYQSDASVIGTLASQEFHKVIKNPYDGLIQQYGNTNVDNCYEYINVANSTTIGAFKLAKVFNCELDTASGLWLGRDANGSCWAEVWKDSSIYERWASVPDSQGALPSWTCGYKFDAKTGQVLIGNGAVADNVGTLCLNGTLSQDTHSNQLSRIVKSGTRAIREYSDITDGGKAGLVAGSISELATTFNALYSAAGSSRSLSCTTTDLSVSITTASTTTVKLGDSVSGVNVPANSWVTEITNGTTFKINQAATGSGTNSLTLTTHWTRDRANDTDHSYLRRLNESYEEEVWYADCTTANTGVLWQLRSRVQLTTGYNYLYGRLELTQDPLDGPEAATKQYVDATAQGLNIKTAVDCMTVGDLTLSGVQTVDGYAGSAGVTRVLVALQTNPADNGIYLMNAGAWTRTTDSNAAGAHSAPSASNLIRAYVFVANGTTKGNTSWVMAVNPYTLDTTGITWIQFFSAGIITASNGLIKSGNDIQLKLLSTDLAVNGSNQLNLATVNQAGGGSLVKIALDTKGRVTGNSAVILADLQPVFAGSANFGIGTNSNTVSDTVSANRALVVASSSSSTTLNASTAALVISNNNTTTGNAAQLNFASITGANPNHYSSAVISCQFGARTNAQYPTGNLIFSTSDTANSAPTEKFRIHGTSLLVGGIAHVWDEKFGVRSNTTTQTGLGVYNGTANFASSLVRVQAETAASQSWLLFDGRCAGGTQVARIYGDGSAYFNGPLVTYGALTVGNGLNSSNIYMYDADDGTRTIHCNSNLIGFLTQNSSWGAYCDDSGNWTASGDVTAFSDVRLKKDIVSISNALDLVDRLRGVYFNRKDTGKASIGLIAQELREIFPQLVMEGTDENKTLSIAYGNLVGVLVEAIKELRAEVINLKGR